ncbi:MAG: hypothetical protein QM767_21020 [Anaeromyxobacter sp.]
MDARDEEGAVRERHAAGRDEVGLGQVSDVLAALAAVDLRQLPKALRGSEVARRLSHALDEEFGSAVREPAPGVDGAVRTPDHVVELREAEGGPVQAVAVAYRILDFRQLEPGQLDRTLGECLAYAERYQAVVLAVVYLERPPHPVPPEWRDPGQPLHLERGGRRVPLHVLARPADWDVLWAEQFERKK